MRTSTLAGSELASPELTWQSLLRRHWSHQVWVSGRGASYRELNPVPSDLAVCVRPRRVSSPSLWGANYDDGFIPSPPSHCVFHPHGGQIYHELNCLPATLAVPFASSCHTQALEEQNLFFIQNSQETEHALDELKQNFGKVQKTMDAKTQVCRDACCGSQRTTPLPNEPRELGRYPFSYLMIDLSGGDVFPRSSIS